MGCKICQSIMGVPRLHRHTGIQPWANLEVGFLFSLMSLHTRQNLPKSVMSQHKETEYNPNHS